MAQNPLAVIASVEDVVVLPESSHIVITLGVVRKSIWRWSRTWL